MKYARLVGIDVGTKRVGIAQTDLLLTVANPVGTFSPDEAFLFLKNMIDKEPILGLVFGWPLTPNGDESAATEMVQQFITRITQVAPDIPVYKVDERYTSNQAMNYMVMTGVPSKKRRDKKRVDTIAACIILQQYLDESSS